MINNLKLGVRVLRYGYGIGMSLIQGALFLLMGGLFFVMDVTSFGSAFQRGFFGNFMFMCIGMLPAQVLYSLSAVSMVQASPMKKKLQTAVPTAITWVSMTFLYLVTALMRGIVVLMQPERLSEVCIELVALGVIIAFLMLYTGVAYKYFLAITIFFALSFWLIFFYRSWMISWWNLFGTNENTFSFVLAVVTGLTCIAAGGIGEYLLSLLVYRAPMSKMAQMAPLRKEL